jgi:hypothetical protein
VSDKKLKPTTRKAERTSSITLSSQSESDETPTPKKEHKKPAMTSKKRDPKAHNSDKVKAAKEKHGKHDKTSSSRNDSTLSTSEDPNVQSKTIPKASSKAKASSPSPSSSEDSDSESQPRPKSQKSSTVNASTTKESVSTHTKSKPKVENDKLSDLQTETRVTKKQRTDVEGKSVATAIDVTIPAGESGEEPRGRGRKDKMQKNQTTTITRFSRVNPSKIQSVVDNSYVAKVCCIGFTSLAA